MKKVKIIAEIGINHNGSIEIAKRLIDIAILSGCDYAKFQKRTPELCTPEAQKDKIRDTPWGSMRYIDYKNKIEFGKKEYDEIYRYIQDKPIEVFASVWDQPSVDFMSNYTDIMKIGSASITDLKLCAHARKNSNTLIVSTGMSSESEIDRCVDVCTPDVIMHTNSTYPSPVEELNLGYIKWLTRKHNNKSLNRKIDVGYSGHEYGLVTTFAAVALGANWIERHITLDRTMWGSDQLSSIEPCGLIKLVKGIRDIEKAIPDSSYAPRQVYSGELRKRDSLRK